MLSVLMIHIIWLVLQCTLCLAVRFTFYDLINWEFAAYVYDTLDSTPGQGLEGEANIYGKVCGQDA